MSGYTPGPWVVRHDEFDGFCVHAPTIEHQTGCLYRVACNINGDKTPNPKYGTPEANASLIAAAPDLLDALILANAYLMGEPSPRNLNGADIADIVQAVIAAATGESAS